MTSYIVMAYRGPDLPHQFVGLIYSKWLRSYRYNNDFIRLSDPAAYYPAYNSYISKILSDADTVIRLAQLTDDMDVVLGFSVSRKNILDYVHVHSLNRKMGIGRKLIPPGIDTISHLTRIGLSIWGTKFGKWKFNPFV